MLIEAKDVDDKQVLIEGHLLESKLIYNTGNISKAKAALTASKTATANVYISPGIQADIDETAGAIHLADKDY